jgi:small subunit ribosomal protein S20
MPNSPSAKKRFRQSLDRRARNRAAKSSIRRQIRKVREAIAAASDDAAWEQVAAQYRLAVKQLDKAASAKVIHANLAARVKSRLNKAIKVAKSGGA